MDSNSHEVKVPESTGSLRVLFKVFLSLLIVGAGVAGAAYIKNMKPETRKRKPVQMAALVKVQPVFPETRQVVVEAMGSVIPAREMVLKSRVAGEIVAIHPQFNEGGFLEKGALVFKIDPQDYTLDIIRKKKAVASADFALKLEQGHQDVARREWELLNDSQPATQEDLDLALRVPHLQKARSDLAAAMADLEQANTNLERTRVYAPFNTIVRSSDVEMGSQVSPQEPLAQLVGVDTYWVQVSIPIDRLKWITIPRGKNAQGSPVRIFYRGEFQRDGEVIKLLADLDPQGRMARVLVAVKDPLDLKLSSDNRLPTLLLGEYVRVEIEGQTVDNVYRLSRATLRDNARVWVADEEDKLDIRTAEIVWREADAVLVKKGLYPGERVVVSDLAIPVHGMPLSVQADVSKKVEKR
jgi:RND family efflux transporter MFP subunit